MEHLKLEEGLIVYGELLRIEKHHASGFSFDLLVIAPQTFPRKEVTIPVVHHLEAAIRTLKDGGWPVRRAGLFVRFIRRHTISDNRAIWQTEWMPYSIPLPDITIAQAESAEFAAEIQRRMIGIKRG